MSSDLFAGMIEITGVDLVAFAKKVYELSVPRGMGFLHARPGPLLDHEASALVEQYAISANDATGGMLALDMDYVNGRGCKMHVYRSPDNRLYIPGRWYDHTDAEFAQLLAAFNVPQPSATEHQPSCECDTCVRSRPLRERALS